MVPRFEKRVQAFAADTSGLALLVILTSYGMPDFEFRSLVQLLILLLGFFLIIVLPILTKSRQTFGKRIQKIKVINMNDTNPGVIKLISREVFKYFLSIATFGVYLVIAYFALTEKEVSRTIHDYVFKTKVIDLNVPNKNNDGFLETKTMKDTRLD